PSLRQLFGPQIEPVVPLPENRAFAGALINNDEGQLACAIRHLDQMRLDALVRKLLALESPCGVAADLPHVAASQSPAPAGHRCRGRLSSGKQGGREDFGLRVTGREAGHTNQRVSRIEPDGDDVCAVRCASICIGRMRMASTRAVCARRHKLKTLCNCQGFASAASATLRCSLRYDNYIHLRRSEEHTSELQSPCNLVCRLLL